MKLAGDATWRECTAFNYIDGMSLLRDLADEQTLYGSYFDCPSDAIDKPLTNLLNETSTTESIAE